MGSIEDLRTPTALVDLRKLERNLGRMGDRARELGVRLRPHIKTHKSVEIGRLQTQGQLGGITVSTLAEASVFAREGFRDITWALPIPLSCMADAVQIVRAVDRLSLLVDHATTVTALEDFARSEGIRFDVLLKIDCGNHRAGVDPRSEQGGWLAKRIASSSTLRFCGVLAHAGHAYSCTTREQVERVAEQERDETVGFARRLQESGVPVETVSVGSTPTMSVIRDLSGVTEIRPGNYAFFDVFQATLGSCTLEDVALSVLTTILGVYPDRDTFLIDAGALALSMDPGPRRIDPEAGYGLVITQSGALLRLTSLSQEHGVVSGLSRAGTIAPGEKVRVLPNHSCLTAGMFSEYVVIEGDQEVNRWRLARGWNP